MSILSEYRATKEAIEELQERLKNLEQDEKLQKEKQFEEELRQLMNTHQKSLPDIIAIIDPNAKLTKSVQVGAKPAVVKRTRKVKQYKNPHTGEVIETKGGNHKILKAWKAKWSPEEVESWATLLD